MFCCPYLPLRVPDLASDINPGEKGVAQRSTAFGRRAGKDPADIDEGRRWLTTGMVWAVHACVVPSSEVLVRLLVITLRALTLWCAAISVLVFCLQISGRQRFIHFTLPVSLTALESWKVFWVTTKAVEKWCAARRTRLEDKCLPHGAAVALSERDIEPTQVGRSPP